MESLKPLPYHCLCYLLCIDLYQPNVNRCVHFRIVEISLNEKLIFENSSIFGNFSSWDQSALHIALLLKCIEF